MNWFCFLRVWVSVEVVLESHLDLSLLLSKVKTCPHLSLPSLLPLFMGSVGSLTTSSVVPARSLAFSFSFSPLCLLLHQVLCILPPEFSKPSSHLLAHSHPPSQATPVWTQRQAPDGFHCDDPLPHVVQPPNHGQRESFKSSYPLGLS